MNFMRDAYVFDIIFIHVVVTHNAAALNYRTEITDMGDVIKLCQDTSPLKNSNL